jgi:carbonic anhydrase
MFRRCPQQPVVEPLHPELTSRRNFGVAAAGVCAAVAAWSNGSERPVQAAEQPMPESPQAALEMLYEGNQRFAGGKSLAAHRDIERVRSVAPRQTPYVAFLGCADSRVPIEIVFDQGFGDLFVTRIAGNVASSEIIGSLEFGTLVLGAKVLYVLGHTNCGAVSATLQAEEVPGQISGLFQHIRPAVKAGKGDLRRSIEENVRNQAQLIAESSPVIRRLLRDKKLQVAGGVYDLGSGIVTPVPIEL